MIINLSAITIYFFIAINALFFFIGYLLGKKHINNVYVKTDIEQNKNLINKNKINIDETKIITNIDTKGLEKKYTVLGHTQTKDINISQSVDKLKHLKG